MARPPAQELTERELEVMHVFWNRGESTVADVRDALGPSGLDRAYTTVATLVRILADKKFWSRPTRSGLFAFGRRGPMRMSRGSCLANCSIGSSGALGSSYWCD